METLLKRRTVVFACAVGLVAGLSLLPVGRANAAEISCDELVEEIKANNDRYNVDIEIATESVRVKTSQNECTEEIREWSKRKMPMFSPGKDDNKPKPEQEEQAESDQEPEVKRPPSIINPEQDTGSSTVVVPMIKSQEPAPPQAEQAEGERPAEQTGSIKIDLPKDDSPADVSLPQLGPRPDADVVILPKDEIKPSEAKQSISIELPPAPEPKEEPQPESAPEPEPQPEAAPEPEPQAEPAPAPIIIQPEEQAPSEFADQLKRLEEQKKNLGKASKMRDEARKRCSVRLEHLWGKGEHNIKGTSFRLTGVYTLDLDNDGLVDNVALKLKSRGRIDNVIRYFSLPGRLSGQSVDSLKLDDDSLIFRLCAGRVNFERPEEPEPEAKEVKKEKKKKKKEPDAPIVADEKITVKEETLKDINIWFGVAAIFFLMIGAGGVGMLVWSRKKKMDALNAGDDEGEEGDEAGEEEEEA